MSETKYISIGAEKKRNTMLSEILLWKALSGGKMGTRFQQKVSIEDFIVGFYSKELKLAIEVDKNSDYDPVQKEIDQIRDNKLHDLGITVLRIDDQEIKRSLSSVLRFIEHKIEYLKKGIRVVS
ncbi:MAG: endonuclease domain-containing protein [Balneola sp.]